MTPPLASSYPGGAFDPSFAGGKLGGSLRVEAGSLVFESGDTRISLPLEGAEISSGGAADRLIFFKHPAYPDRSLYSSSGEILHDERLKLLPRFSEKLASLKGRRRNASVLAWSTAGLVLALIGLGIWWLKEHGSAMVAKKAPVSWEEKLGEAAFVQFKAMGKVMEDEKLEGELKRLAKPLFDKVPSEGFKFKLHLSQDGSLNAFALPGGHMVVNTGLILEAERPEEVLGVLGHEAAHVVKRHGIQQMVRSLGLYFLISAILGDSSGVLAVLLENSSFLLSQKFSRDFEREADEVGWEYLVAAKLDPAGLIRFFERMEELQKKSPLSELDGRLNFMSTHPATAERVKELKEKLKAHQGNIVPSDFDLKAFQNLIRARLGRKKGE